MDKQVDNKKVKEKEQKSVAPDIEFLEDIEYENDITELENQKYEADIKRSTNAKKKNNSKSRAKREALVEGKGVKSGRTNGTKKGTMSSKQKKALNKKKQSAKRFRKGLLIYAAVMLVIIAGVWIFFYSFIDGYEKGMPAHKIEEVAENFDAAKVDELFAGVSNPNEFESVDYVSNHIKDIIKGKEVKVQEAPDNTEKNPSYELMVDQKPFAKVALVQNGTIKHGFKKWEVSSVSVDGYLNDTTDITVFAPDSAKVYINGVEVNDSYIVEKDVKVSALEDVAQYLTSVPTETKYEIKGFFERPSVVVKDNSGKEMGLIEDKNTYTAGFSYDEATKNEFLSYVEDVTYAYARNFANLEKNVFNYVRPGSDLYAAIESATTYFYPNSKISGTDFTAREITDFIRYSDDCFSCHVNYEYTIYFTNYSTDKDVQKVDMIWTFVQKDGLWYLTDTKYYTAE